MGDRNWDAGTSGRPPTDAQASGYGGTDGTASRTDAAGTLTGTVVLNGLRDVVDGSRTVLADEGSVRALEEAYRAATTADERTAVAAAFEGLDEGDDASDADASDASDGDSGSGERPPAETVERVVAAVVHELSVREATLAVDHEVPLDPDERAVRVHRFFEAREPSILSPLADGAVADALRRGATAARDGEWEAAAAAFGAAVDAAEEDSRSGLTARVLAAWATHWAGDDAAALDLVEEALRLETEAWDARLVGVAADHSSPEWFREGRLSSDLYLRVRAAMPDGASVDAAVVGADGSVDRLDGDPSCFRVHRLPLDGRLRLRLRGAPGALPDLHAYYLAVGVVEPESARPRTVQQTLLDGPVTASATERLRVRLPE